MRRYLWVAGLLGLVIACTTPGKVSKSSGTESDAGALTPPDAGLRSDAGSTGTDATLADAQLGDPDLTEAGAGASDAGGDASVPLPSGPDVDRSDPKLSELKFEPKDLDAQASEWLFTEYAYLDTRVEPVGRLVVYLVGAGGKPSGGITMMKFLAEQGFHTLAPAYANDYGIGTNCVASDKDCKADKRLEAFEGKDHSPHIEVTAANSIETRVVAMLEALREQHPEGDWAYFLDGAKPRWGSIVVMGHSHGASSAALIGKVRKTERAISLSGPFDNDGKAPDPWLSWPSETPVDRFFGFSHASEDQHAGHVKAWAAMGLDALGDVVTVENATPPYGGSHELVTAEDVTNTHGSTTAGGSSPKLPDGSFQFAPVWRQMLGL